MQKLWDEDRAMRIKRTTEITLMLSDKLMEAKDAQIQRRLQSMQDFRRWKIAFDRSLLAGLLVCLLLLLKLLRDAADAANRTIAPTVVERADAAAAPVPAAAQTVVYDEREFVAWIVQAGAAYSDAVNLWAAARQREDALRDTIETLRKEVGP